MNYNERLVQVNPDFIRDALYDHYQLVKDNRGGEIYEKFIDDFVDLVAECWTSASSPWEIIDNWLINWEHYTYEEIYKREFEKYHEKEREELEEEEKEEVLEEIHEYCENKCFYFDDELEECISM